MRFVGQVQRLEDVFDAVRLTVAPLRFGAGLKGKVLDSLAAGVPCAMTPIAAEGLPLSQALRGLVAESAEALADTILDYYHRSGLNRSHADGGLAMVGQHYTAAAVRAAMAAAVGMEAIGTVVRAAA
jgi:glycosyltransferase involved in cell wall biosynthesis